MPCPILLAIPDYGYLQDELCASKSLVRGEVECRQFPDGERYLRILTPVHGREVVVCGGTISDAATLALYDLACAAVRYGAERLTLLVPYFGYATMERATEPGEVVVAKTRARLLSAIPIASRGNQVVLFDLHSEGIAYYFEGSLTAVHVYGRPLIKQAISKLGYSDYVLGTADAGRSKWVQALANDLGVDVAFVFKRRINDRHTEVLAMNADVNGRCVVIYDDMIRTGSSLLSAAKAYKDAGAKEVAVVASHGVFVGNAVTRLLEGDTIAKIICTNSHPISQNIRDVEVVSVAELLLHSIV